jgi:glycerol-3-phosphate responsive antiterminator
MVVEIVLFNGVDIVVPGAAPKIGSRLLHGKHMQVLDGGLVRRGITPDSKHATLILLH